MGYINPGQLFQEYFQPTVKSILPIVPSLMANRRAQEEMALREGLAQKRWEQEGGQRAAQANYYNQKAREAEIANKAYSQLLGGTGEMTSLGGIKPEQALAHKFLGTPYPTLKTIYQPSNEPGQPGKYVYGYPEAGQEAKPETEAMTEIKYWVRGPQGWMQTGKMVPKETYNQAVRDIETQGGQMNEPPEIDIQKAVAQYEALAPKKLAALEYQLKAKGIDVSKWGQQQKFWYQVVKDKANREIQIVSNTATSLKQAKEDLEGIEREVYSEVQRIAVGQPPSYLTPPGGTPQGTPGPLPIGQPQAAPQAVVGGNGGTPPVSKLKEGVITTFKNGQAWTIENGQPKRVR